MKRRDFLKLSMGSVATILVGSKLPFGEAEAAVIDSGSTIDVQIVDCMKEMVTFNAINPGATCYFWGYDMHVISNGVVTDIPYETPGPVIRITKGDSITFTVTNRLPEPHAFCIPGATPGAPPQFDTGPIPSGQTVSLTFTANQVGCFLYHDNLNAPVNRVMGLHGAMIVMPDKAKAGHNWTPYDPNAVSDGVQKMYDDFGGVPSYNAAGHANLHWPGLKWEEGDPSVWAFADPGATTPATTPFRQYVWVASQASPKLFGMVGDYFAQNGTVYPADQFVQLFLHDTFSPIRDSCTPEYFTINGQSGFFAHFGPYSTPMGRVGEPAVVHIINAGLWTHSMHLHANHFYVTSVNGVVSENPIWVDVYNVKPMDRIDYTIPFMRPPDLPNVRGIGYPDKPLQTVDGHPVWPPVDELNLYLPGPGQRMAKDINGNRIDLMQRMSPLCYPMHDHSEPSQTAQGGNYNCGLISGIYFTGDRNIPGYKDFPMDEDFRMFYRNIRGCAPGVWPPAGDTAEGNYDPPEPV